MVKWDGSVELQLTYRQGRRVGAEVQPGWALHQLHVIPARGGEGRPGMGDGPARRRGRATHRDYRSGDRRVQLVAGRKKLLLTLRPKNEPDPKRASPRPPKPIVIDRYHFKQDIQGYLRDDAWNSLYMYDTAPRSGEANHGQKCEGRTMRSGRRTGNGLRSRATRRQTRIEASIPTCLWWSQGRIDAEEAHDVEGPDEGQLAWSPDSKSIAYTQGATLKLWEYSQSRPAVVTLNGKVSYPAAKLDRAVRSPIYRLTAS